jgi:hypothetical protein
MSRLLHAAARGARIQSQWRDAHTPTYQEWQTNNQFVFIDTMRHYRIHPVDEHLQYGPISTALREMAINDLWYPPSWQISLAITVSLDVTREFSELLFSRRENEDYPLFYLFLAEFLADEGM